MLGVHKHQGPVDLCASGLAPRHSASPSGWAPGPDTGLSTFCSHSHAWQITWTCKFYQSNYVFLIKKRCPFGEDIVFCLSFDAKHVGEFLMWRCPISKLMNELIGTCFHESTRASKEPSRTFRNLPWLLPTPVLEYDLLRFWEVKGVGGHADLSLHSQHSGKCH